jgi:uncharacterized membrane protein YGL010W
MLVSNIIFFTFIKNFNMRQIDKLLSEYGESHQNPTNKLVHWICVPIIFWSITALLWLVKLPIEIEFLQVQLNLTLVILVLVLVYYTRLSVPLSIGMTIFSIICGLVSHKLELLTLESSIKLWMIALGAFIIAWIFQFWGHNIEGKKPSFLKDLQFLLVGPAWLMHFIFKKVGLAY